MSGNNLGKVLLLQIVSRDDEQDPTTVWFLAQAESTSNPGLNKFRGIAQYFFIRENKGINGDGGKVFPIEQWIKWMGKGTSWTHGILKTGRSYQDFVTGSINNFEKDHVASFINSKGTVNSSEDIIIASDGQTDRKQ